MFPGLHQTVLSTSSLESARQIVLETPALTSVGVACFHIRWHTSVKVRGQPQLIFFRNHSPYLLRQGASLTGELELTDWADSPKASGIPLVPPEHWDYKCKPPNLTFFMGSGWDPVKVFMFG